MIAEPGRFYVASAFTLATSIHSKRSVRGNENSNAITHNMYYINDGVYGSFNCLLYDHQHVIPIPLKVKYFIQMKYRNIFSRSFFKLIPIIWVFRMVVER